MSAYILDGMDDFEAIEAARHRSFVMGARPFADQRLRDLHDAAAANLCPHRLAGDEPEPDVIVRANG